MKKKTIRVLAAVLALTMLLALCITGAYADGTFKTFKNSNMADYVGDYDEKTYPRESVKSDFTTDKIVVDGKMDKAYENAAFTKIDNLINGAGYGEGVEGGTYGEFSTVWDGTTMYVYVNVYDADIRADESITPGATSNPAVVGTKTVTYPFRGYGWGEMWDNYAVTSVTENCDSIAVAFDLYNDKATSDTDTHGVVTFDALGRMFYYSSSNIPSLGSPLGDPTHPEYMNVIKAYASTPILTPDKVQVGYTLEIAFYVGETNPENGTKIGLDFQINDCNEIVTGEEEVENPDYNPEDPMSPEMITVDKKEVKKSASIFWSHAQESLYTSFDHEHTNAVDWGTVVLDGHEDEEYAVDDWKLKKLVDYIESDTFAEGVYTEESQKALDAALPLAKTVAHSTYFDAELAEQAYTALKAAFDGLRWADTTYPDPADLPVENTLPNPYKFFQSDRMVEDTADWEERKAEILDLAQFYEYGYKPDYDKLELSSISFKDAKTATVKVKVTVGEVTKELSITVNLPEESVITAQGHKAPVMLAYGKVDQYLASGIACAVVPTVASDTRTNAYAWGKRTGVFYELYPYSRNGEGALKEVSVTMAQAWATSVTIDALQLLKDSQLENAATLYAKLDTEKYGTTGFSYQGKYAFVAAVFDERIGVCIPGAAGASATSPWRYVYRGQVHDFRDTIYANADRDASVVTAFGTELLANSVRHNRVRETELFRHFLTFGHFCEAADGAYGYATRLPYDQNDLVATMAPRAVIINNTVNDYNDGSVADALSLEVATAVYNALGYDGEALLKYNYNGVYTAGDPHHQEGSQRAREAEYMNNYWFGTVMSEETEERLSTDPFALDICNDQTENVYEFYWGGYNTITGGKDGVNGTDGWYYYQLTINGITYEDGADGDAFTSQFFRTSKGDKVPSFEGTPSRENYLFKNWKYFDEEGQEIAESDVASYMGIESITAVAQWVNQGSTGDNTNIVLYVSMLLLMGAGLLVVLKTRKEN